MTPWETLTRELDRWAAAGRTATFWWRDDDAAEATAELDRLLGLRSELDIPLALAAIPAKARSSLASSLAGASDISVLQHGFAHANHGPDVRRKTELGPHRPAWNVAQELAAGRARLSEIFGDRMLPVLVPPWNRIDAGVVALLPGLGYTGLSTFAEREAREAAPGVIQVNAHVDIIDWSGTRRFVGDAAAVSATSAHLEARRAAGADADEATGLLTHHLAHDADCWTFARRLVNLTKAHGAARWISASEAFAA